MGILSSVFNFIFKKESKNLITELEKEHKELFQIYSKIEVLLANEKFNEVSKQLNRLYFKYKKHILYENNYFYAKLFKKYKAYENIVDFIKLTRDELNEMTSKFEQFMRIYNNADVIKEKFKEFSHDFIALGEALKERVEFEEKRLYVLY